MTADIDHTNPVCAIVADIRPVPSAVKVMLGVRRNPMVLIFVRDCMSMTEKESPSGIAPGNTSGCPERNPNAPGNIDRDDFHEFQCESTM
jgi:hypothetical protein